MFQVVVLTDVIEVSVATIDGDLKDSSVSESVVGDTEGMQYRGHGRIGKVTRIWERLCVLLHMASL